MGVYQLSLALPDGQGEVRERLCSLGNPCVPELWRADMGSLG